MIILSEKISRTNLRHLAIAAALLVISSFLFSACSKDKISDPPDLIVFVNDIDVTAAPTLYFTEGTRVEYRFEITASATISSLKTVVFDVSIPTAKKTKEVIVGGLPDSLKETVKGVLFASIDTEIMLVVKDIDGNEVTKSFTVIVQ
jgi:hypothetical protein